MTWEDMERGWSELRESVDSVSMRELLALELGYWSGCIVTCQTMHDAHGCLEKISTARKRLGLPSLRELAEAKAPVERELHPKPEEKTA